VIIGGPPMRCRACCEALAMLHLSNNLAECQKQGTFALNPNEH
jgi:hypothetical protein